MPTPWRLAMVRRPTGWRRLFADRRRGAAVLLVADTVLLSAAAMVWLPLLTPDRVATPVAPPPPSVVGSPSPTITTPVGGQPPVDASRVTGDVPPSGPAHPVSRPGTVPPGAPRTADPALPPSPTVPPPETVLPSGLPTEHEIPPSLGPLPTPAH